MKTTEFMFRFRGSRNETLRYSAIVVHGISVAFIRIGSAEAPFSLMVPRVHDETFAHASAEHLVRLAIAQAIYDELFEAHPQHTIDLNVHGPLWDGELETGQWQHGADAEAPEPLAAASAARSQFIEAETDNTPVGNPQALRGTRALV